jgi:hypothetical protein
VDGQTYVALSFGSREGIICPVVPSDPESEYEILLFLGLVDIAALFPTLMYLLV